MFYKNYLLIFIFIIITNCTTSSLINNKPNLILDNNFTNKGFALIYDDNLYKKKIISKKLNPRSLEIFQKNLKKNTMVKITNIINKKTLIAKVSSKSSYPLFYNSVISPRIATELDLNLKEPYIEIYSISENFVFVAKRAKTYDEEKQVADKAPVESVTFNDIDVKKEKIIINDFSYIIKIADFYYNKTALLMLNRIKNKTKIKNPKILKLSSKEYRVYLGPFNNINSLQKYFNDISILEFENIEIIKND